MKLRAKLLILTIGLCLAGCSKGVSEVAPKEMRVTYVELPARLVTGDALVDGFSLDILNKDRASAMGKVAGLESASGRSPGDLNPYMDKIISCGIEKIGPYRGIEQMFEILWACEDGKLSSLVDSKFRAPKLVLTELRRVKGDNLKDMPQPSSPPLPSKVKQH